MILSRNYKETGLKKANADEDTGFAAAASREVMLLNNKRTYFERGIIAHRAHSIVTCDLNRAPQSNEN